MPSHGDRAASGGDRGGVAVSDDPLGNDDGGSTIEPTAAFDLLAHDTRLAAMRVLWAADDPLRFSEVADRAGVRDTGNFNYHFGKLVGHFVRNAGDRYELTRSGRQAMTAVLAGDVTERPAFDPVTVDEPCPYCGSQVELHHDADVLRVRCTSCEGTFQGDRRAVGGTPNPPGTVTTFAFPAAGLADRDPETVLEAALVRLVSRYTDMANGVCPDCAGPVERETAVCDAHDPAGVCERCDARFAGVLTVRCETCGTTKAGLLALAALADPRLRRAFHDHGFDPLEPTWRFALAWLGATETVHDTHPVDYEAAWTLDDETVSVRLDGDGAVTDLRRD
jgi:hypothetical protein